MSGPNPLGRTRARGFSVLEVALSIVILALLLGAMTLPLQTQLETRMVDETEQLLEQAREALLGYLVANGHFPCPADALSNGYEPLLTDHDAGLCGGGFIGFLPAAELGMTKVDAQGYAVDAWGGIANRIRYAVTDQTVSGVTYAYTSEGGLASIDVEALDSTDLLYVCASGTGVTGVDCGAATVLTSRAAVVIWSVGPNARTGGASVDEAQNPNPNGGLSDRVFVSRPRSSGVGTEFDDVVTWIPITVIVNRMVAAGYLP